MERRQSQTDDLGLKPDCGHSLNSKEQSQTETTLSRRLGRPEVKPKPTVNTRRQMRTSSRSSVSKAIQDLEADLCQKRCAVAKRNRGHREVSLDRDYGKVTTNLTNKSPSTSYELDSTKDPLTMPRPHSEDTCDGYGGSDYIRVYPGDGQIFQRDDSSCEEYDDNVELGATVDPGIKHLNINININFAKCERKRKKNKEKRFQKMEGAVSLQKSKMELETKSVNPDPVGLAPPVPPRMYRTDPNMNDALLAEEEPYEICDIKDPPLNNTKRRPRSYDEIVFPNIENDIGETTDGTEEPGTAVMMCSSKNTSPERVKERETGGEELLKTRYPWLFDHTQREKAEESLKTDQNGSFAVIEEDVDILSLNPYTLLVVSDEHLREIPVTRIKHSLNRRKTIYTLPNALWFQESIQELVAYYQRHVLPSLKHKLLSHC